MKLRGALLATWMSIVAAAVAPNAAHAVPGQGVVFSSPGDSVVIYSEPGDFVGAGKNHVFHSGNAEIHATPTDIDLTVYASGGNLGGEYSLRFRAPWDDGPALRPGVYDKARRSGTPTRGGIDIGGDGRGCNETSGRFEVKDVAYAADGAPQRLWVVFEQRCGDAMPALFGEIRLGMPAPEPPAFTAPEILRWPAWDLGKTEKVVPVTAVATGPAQFGSASVVGAHAADFPIRADGCAGKSLPAGGQCDVAVAFTPAAAGTRVATLRIPHSSGRVEEVLLQGFSYGGRTRVVMHSEPGDWIGGGQSYSYTPGNSVIHPIGTREHVRFFVNPAGGGYWDGNFSPPEGGVIGPGRYTGAMRDPFRGSAAGIEVTGNNRGCNTMTGEFTVHEARFDVDGKLETISLDFVQHCNGEPPALRGTWEHRAGDTTPPAPWMDGGSWGTGDATGGGPGGGGANPEGTNAPWPTAPASERPKSGACALQRFAALPLMKGTPATDRMRGTRAAEILFAGRGDDVVRAGGGNDCVDGGYHRDVLKGGTGSDYLSGESGNDRLVGGPGRDFLNCGTGSDVAVATPGDRTRSCERVVRAGVKK